MSKYGYFDNPHREYIVTDPRTPRKWINYIGDMNFGGFVDHTGGSLLCKGDPGLNRITRYIAQLPASDFKGETLYLRIRKGSHYHVLRPFFTPGANSLTHYECHIGLGYTRIISIQAGIQCDVLIFVPQGASCELRQITLKNLTREKLSVDVIPVVEYSHFDALKQFTNADWVPQTMQSQLIQLWDHKIILKQCAYMQNGQAENYFCSDHPIDSFETDRRVFLGHNEYGSWTEPASLLHDHLAGTLAQNGDNIAALMIRVEDLQPDQEHRVLLQLGQVNRIEDHIDEILNWFHPNVLDNELERLSAFWQNYLLPFQIETPDDSFNTLVNIHNPRQCYTTKTWSRYLSLYQLGYGSRGMGVRDSAQDVMAVLASIPDEARKLLTQLLSVQKPDGSAMHQFYPINMQASVGDSAEYADRPHYYCDDHLWIVLAVCEYLKETGDFDFLKTHLPYYSEGSKSPQTVSVADHLDQALTFTFTNTGKHGLPLLGFADWNDTINLPSGAESALAACLFGKACLEVEHLYQYLEQPDKAIKIHRMYDEMKSRFLSSAWDGEWYRSYFDQHGNPLGSAANTHGKIYLYGQAWPILAGFASPEQASSSLSSVQRLLNTRHGLKLSAPGFNGYDREIGGITTYPPGAKENGGIFVHVNPWVIIAETLMGDPERAYHYYQQINPVLKNDEIDVYEMEPFVFSQNILADEHPKFGMARNSWLSGTASWMYQAATQYILGVKPDYRGLSIQPCIPSEWKKVRVDRKFRGATYQITIENPHGRNKQVRTIHVDGKLIDGSFISAIDDHKEHEVIVSLG